MSDRPTPSAWCVVANVTRTPHPEGQSGKLALGLKNFVPGAKLYLFRPRWGDGGGRMEALGRHRGSARLVRMVVATRWLENFRAKEVFQPHVEAEMLGAGGWTEADARAFAAERTELNGQEKDQS